MFSKNLKNMIPSNNTYQRPFKGQLICTKIHLHRSSETPLTLEESRLVVVFANLGVTRILCSFRMVLEGMAGHKIPESSILEFSEGIPANNFCPIRCKR